MAASYGGQAVLEGVMMRGPSHWSVAVRKPDGDIAHVSRHIESEADWVALEATEDPAAGRGLFEEFSSTSLARPNPPTWAYLFLETHPTIMQRIAMTKAWRVRNPRASTPNGEAPTP